jgi:hypothetical protein
VYTNGGWLRFEVNDGELTLAGYRLYWGWRGSLTENPDGSLSIHLWHRYGWANDVYVDAYIDEDGYLHVDVS